MTQPNAERLDCLRERAPRRRKPCSSGANYVLIMGDGSGQFFAAVNPQLKKLDNGAGEYIAQVIGSTGYSRGEDKLMGPPEWKSDPQQPRAAWSAGVLRDGDWNIAMKWAADNQIKNNPERKKRYEPEALNGSMPRITSRPLKSITPNTCEDRKWSTMAGSPGIKKTSV